MHSRKFQITVEKKYVQSFDFLFGTVMTKLELFDMIERKMYHASGVAEGVRWVLTHHPQQNCALISEKAKKTSLKTGWPL